MKTSKNDKDRETLLTGDHGTAASSFDGLELSPVRQPPATLAPLGLLHTGAPLSLSPHFGCDR